MSENGNNGLKKEEEEMITTAKRRMRRDFAPLELFADIVTAGAGSGVTQVYDGATGEHEPDRSITPLVLVPYVLAEAPDGSFSGGDVREQLRNGRWYVNGTAIESATGWSGGFTVSQEAGTKWQLTVRRNFTPGERADLTFRAELADTRTGVLVPVTCGPVTLTCTERASDMWALMTGGDTIMIYDPLRDNLLRHDYLVAEGQEAESTPVREALEKEQTSYVRRVPVELWRGGEKWAHQWALVAAKIGPSGELTRVRAGDGDLVSCDDSTGLVMDLRLTEKTDLVLMACVAAADAGTAGTDVPVSVGEELKCVARVQVSAERVDAAFSAEIQNTADIAAGDTRRAQRAVVSAGGGTVEHAEAVLDMTWKTDTKAKAGTVVGYGRLADFALAETGLTEAYDDYMDVYLDMDDRGAMTEAVDEDGSVLTDEDGNVLIFN